MKALALKYRPKVWEDVTEQEEVKVILNEQIVTDTIKHGYLFCGGAGTGKTTCARIFAYEINKGQGNPIEMDAASNNSVEDIRKITQQAQTKSLDSEYKVFIIDECHALSNTAWQAMLKTLEEPPLKTIFIFCTTDPQKIPNTILSRVQRYNFRRISFDGVVNRLRYICDSENTELCENFGNEFEEGEYESLAINYEENALEYIAKIADGGMRDAITLMDKCLSYSNDLKLDNVIKALGTTDYSVMFNLLNCLLDDDSNNIISIIEEIHLAGNDLKQFINLFTNFVLDVLKYMQTNTYKYISIPEVYEESMIYAPSEYPIIYSVLEELIRLKSNIKWESTPKPIIESSLLLLSHSLKV